MNVAKLLLLILIASKVYTITAQNIPAAKIANWKNAGLELNIVYPTTLLDISTFGVAGDGVTKNDAAIRIALANVPSTGAIIFFTAGTYLFDM
jgi:hypothetical protein